MSAGLEAIRPRLATLDRPPTPHDVAAALRAEGHLVSDASVLEAVSALRRESTGAGDLDGLLEVPGVTDVLVNGPDAVWVDRGRGLEPTDLTFPDDESVRALAVRLAASVGRRLDDAQPWVDARLPDGTRLHAVLSPLAWPGTCISLRVPARRRLALSDFVDLGSLPQAGAELLAGMVARRLAFLVSGGTGTGKTTLLGALLGCVPPDERIVVVEDSRELQPDHAHVVHLEGRPANAEGRGAIPLTVLVRQSLRMRPDRVVVGEVRGGEVVDLLAALNTGHEGGCGTIHANSAAHVPARLEALAAMAGLGREALHAQAAAALHAVVHVRREGRRRMVDGVHVLDRVRGDGLVCTPAALFRGDAVVPAAGWEQLREALC